MCIGFRHPRKPRASKGMGREGEKGSGEKGGGRGGERKAESGKRKAEALGSFSIQIISRSQSKQQDMSTDQISFSVVFVREHNRSNCRRSSISCLRSDHLEIFSLLFFV